MDHLQEEILEARDNLSKKEFARLAHLQQEMGMIVEQLTAFAQEISWLDVFTAHAIFAKENRYIQPQLTHQGSIDIQEGRHPVIEKFLPLDQGFIPNTLNF